MNLRGVWVATATFFNQAGALDLNSFEKHCSWLFESGVEGVVPCGTTGEGPTLSPEDRRFLIETAVKVASRKSKQVIAGCGGNNTDSVQKLILEAKDFGAHAALVVTPYYNRPTQEGLVAHYQTLADKSPIPLVLYNVPSRTGVNLLPETVSQLWQHPNIIGLKEATGLHSQWLSLFSSPLPQGKSVLAGDDDAFATLFSLGASGIISASANVVPQHFVQLDSLLRAGNFPEAFALQKKLFPLIKTLFAETNPAPIKFALEKMGRGLNRLRLPLVPVKKETQETICKQLSNLELIS
ncbi:MAG: 4-hydroxy-tetrahydrodipicolinate synthase [Proteobacteria bacterium]|nr:4-hydroxy-tetrahydrodipicolinate synthase [Pseudomonadota bacterium]